jgi:hypothetical protein
MYKFFRLCETLFYRSRPDDVTTKLTRFFLRIQTEQANEIARLIRQYITIDQKSREELGGPQQVGAFCGPFTRNRGPMLRFKKYFRRKNWRF